MKCPWDNTEIEKFITEFREFEIVICPKFVNLFLVQFSPLQNDAFWSLGAAWYFVLAAKIRPLHAP